LLLKTQQEFEMEKNKQEKPLKAEIEKVEENVAGKRLRPLPPEYTALNIAGCVSATRCVY
jgi:hypothetical protein